MAESLEEVRAGEPVSAAKYNALLRAVKELTTKLTGLDPYSAALIAIGPDRWSQCKITEVKITGSPHADSLPGQPAYLQSQIKYHVVGIGRKGIDLDDEVPYYGRPARFDNVLIHPARVGDTCMVERDIDEDGELVHRLRLIEGCEILAFAPCTAPEE